MRHHPLSGIAILLPLALAASAADPPAALPEGPHAVPRVISETTALVPGQVTNLGISFTIEKDWHLYWNGLSDSGMPIQIKPVDLPDTYQWQAQIWPAPHRHEPAEGILDHIYEQRVTVIMPVLVPAGALPGTTQEFRFNLDWLVCKEACVLEKAEVRITLPVAAAAAASPDALLFAQTRATAPILPTLGSPSASPVEIVWHEDAAGVRFPGATVLEFYPSTDSSRPTDLLADGRGGPEALTIRLERKDGQPSLRLDGMLKAQLQDKAVYYWVAAESPDRARSGPGRGPEGGAAASK